MYLRSVNLGPGVPCLCIAIVPEIVPPCAARADGSLSRRSGIIGFLISDWWIFICTLMISLAGDLKLWRISLYSRWALLQFIYLSVFTYYE
jgi:hypothetical protein